MNTLVNKKIAFAIASSAGAAILAYALLFSEKHDRGGLGIHNRNQFQYSPEDAGAIMEDYVMKSGMKFRPAYIYMQSETGYLFGSIQNGGPSYNFVPANRCFEVNGNTGLVSEVKNKDSIKVRKFAYFFQGRFVKR